MEITEQFAIVERLKNLLQIEFEHGTFKGISDETLLRVLLAYSRGYIGGADISYSLVYDMIMEFYNSIGVGYEK